MFMSTSSLIFELLNKGVLRWCNTVLFGSNDDIESAGECREEGEEHCVLYSTSSCN